MSLANEYQRQFQWRAWPAVLDALPTLTGQVVFDLGCGVGDLTAGLVGRGARLVGFDLNEELLQAARSRRIAGAEFRTVDLRSFPPPGLTADGLWCSFAAAYFADFRPVLARWASCLKPGGWIALTEVDDLFGHEPLSERTKELFAAHAENALGPGRYDFKMGRKLQDHLEWSGFRVVKTLSLPDQELSFSGPACPDVLEAWRARFDRMKPLRDFCGSHSDEVQREFLECLLRPDHRAVAQVICCIAVKV